MRPCVQLKNCQGILRTPLAKQVVSPSVEAIRVHAGGQVVLSATCDECLLCSLKAILISQCRRFRRRWGRCHGSQVLYRNFFILSSKTVNLPQGIRIRLQFRVQKRKHDLAHFLISDTPALPIPPVEWIACRQRCMEFCSYHCERSEVAMVHLLYSDESAISVAKGVNGTEVERLIALCALGPAEVQK